MRLLSRPIGSLCAAAVCSAFATPAPAQVPDIGDAVAGARLGRGYAGMLNLATTPDLSAASYRVGGTGTHSDIEVYRLPFERRLARWSDDTELYARIAGAYLTLDSDLPVDIAPLPDGNVASRWSTRGLVGGAFARTRLGAETAIVYGVDASLARLANAANYSGGAEILQPILDNILFNWHSKAYLFTPNVGLAWNRAGPGNRASVNGHFSWSWISSFAESGPGLRFRENIGTYSVRADYAARTGKSIFERPLDWVVLASYAGFLGANRDTLGFSSVAEAGAGFEVPLSRGTAGTTRLRASASYLFGSDVRGWSVSLGLRY